MKVFAWCDTPTSPTGFGRSAKHVLHALHGAGYDIVQLAINADVQTLDDIPWQTIIPTDRANDPYGMNDLAEAVKRTDPDILWTTFDPQVPWSYKVGGMPPGQDISALDLFRGLRITRPGFRMLGWFPIDGGPLSDMELGMLGLGNFFDVSVTMSPHVHELIAWTLRLQGRGLSGQGESIDMEKIRQQLLVVPHGVELDRYHIPTRQEKRDAKERMGFNPDVFLVVQVERNQQRKQNYMGLQVMEELFVRQPALRGKVQLYQHMQQDEESQGCRIGFNLPELAWRFGLKPGDDVRWAPGWVPEEELPRTVYASADAFLSTSAGEGFQYPAWEALATGVPLVVPNDSAREAWFAKAPNVALYNVLPHSRVMPQGYNRRMSTPLPAEAAAAIRKLVKKGGAKRSQAEAGRKFVEEHADHREVGRRWVELVKQQEQELTEERRGMSVVVPGDQEHRTLQVEMLHGPGLGDLILAGPVLHALKRMQPERTLILRIPRTHLEVAKLMGLADQYDVQNVDHADERMAIHDLYHPEHQAGWSDPRTHRTEVIAQHLGVPLEELRPMEVELEDKVKQAVRSQFLEAFGVDPTECVAIAMESGSPHRAMPRGYIPELAQRIRALGAIPLVVGTTGMGLRLHGILDMSGQTEPLYWMGLMDAVGAVITADSATLHVAAMFGTPTVGAFPTFDPDARVRYYSGPLRAVIPPEGTVEAGEAWPAGKAPKAEPGTWARHISVDTMVEALRQLMDLEPAAQLELVRPAQ